MPAIEELTQAEKDKIEINPDFDFREIAKRPFEDLTPNEIGMFKWSGVYHQLQKGFFMIRLRMPGGLLNEEQLHKASNLAEKFGQNRLCVTTRQCLQFHWIRQQDIFKIIEGMAEVGISTRNACGDVTRNVVSCPMLGTCPHEIADTTKMLNTIADDPEFMDKQRNLPRKHKISIAGCGRSCAHTLMNCQGWHPVEKTDKKSEQGWRFYAGGGLGARPYIAKRVFDWVPESIVLDVAKACCEAFNRHGNRRVRAFARLKIIVDKMGVNKFAELLKNIMRENNVERVDDIIIGSSEPDIELAFVKDQEVIPQKQKGLNTVRVLLSRGEFNSLEGSKLADFARHFGDGTLLFTARQNVELRSIPDDKVDELLKKLKSDYWKLAGHELLPDVVACVGTTMCNLAISDTPQAYKSLIDELASDEEWYQSIGPIRINMNGCPNSCGQHIVSDIGLRGTRKREKVGSEEGFSLYIGGSLEGSGHLGRFLCDIYAFEVASTMRKLLNIYLKERKDSKEIFSEYARRVDLESLKKTLSRVSFTSDETSKIDQNKDLKYVFNEAVIESKKTTF